MADYVLERRLWLPRPRPEVFAFFADARRLALFDSGGVRPPWPVRPSTALATGATIDVTLSLAGLPLRWRQFIREFDPPYRFVDAQVKGPFARWEQRHVFREGPEAEAGSGPLGTWVEDRLTYRMPLGVLGRLTHALITRRRIVHVLEQRERRAREAMIARPASAPACSSR